MKRLGKTQAWARYVLVTAARNEESLIENTITSVISQTVLPKKWVIVNDGSTDRTEEIVRDYEETYDFIDLLSKRRGGNRNFSGKVESIKAGYGLLKKEEFEFIGNLDADISLDPNYYEIVLSKFDENPKLGIAGGELFDECEGKFRRFVYSRNTVRGPIQMFRRGCYEEIGGYVPHRIGGEDVTAEVMARMKGWEVKSYSEAKGIHHRQTGTEGRSLHCVRFVMGQEDYMLGYHPLFEIGKCLNRIMQPPRVAGSVLWICGYFWMYFRRPKRLVSDDFIRFLRREQMYRLRSQLSRYIKG